ncbi:hypothetical protein B4072_2038 [Bacillus subtilis]|nr:hypothetical protein B4072_2038 [Bacillus subtilis]
MLFSVLVDARPACPECGTYSKDGNSVNADTCSFCKEMNA